ncbi:MAG: transcription-repair coupling factor [Acidobacteria bacterium]|nr:transcription-repair coupling factor [Acidobacteriota bacterium]
MISPANENTETTRLIREIREGDRVISVSGLTSISAKAFVLAGVQAAAAKTFVVITDSNRDLEIFEGDLEFWTTRNRAKPVTTASIDENQSAIRNPPPAIIALPSFDTNVYSGVSPHAETQERRAMALWQLTRSEPDFLVTSARSLITRTVKLAEIEKLGTSIKRDEDIPPEELVARLVAAGYVREDPLNNFGQFSIRGGILDVWSPDSEFPVRIEFFGDTVDSIRSFDSETQRSTAQLPKVSIAPMREIATTTQDFRDWAFFARENFGGERFARNLRDRTDFADEGEWFSGSEFLLPLVKPLEGTLFDYLADCVFVIDEPAIIEQTLGGFYEQLRTHYDQTVASGDIALEPDALFLDASELRDQLEKKQRIELRALGKIAAGTDENFQFDTEETAGVSAPLFLFPTAEKSSDIEIVSRSTRKFQGDVRQFAASMEADSVRSLFVLQTPGLAERLRDGLREFDGSLPTESIIIGDLSGGFELPSADFKLFTEIDIFGESQHAEHRPPKIQRRTKSSVSAFISDFRDLKSGDFVVHVDHGIGRFEGLQTISAQGAEREFMLLLYGDDAKLFVPVERLDLVSRYSSGEATAPTLDRLGGLGWQKTKAKAKRAMRDMADELLRLYAERKLVEGHAFASDSPWQNEFEDAFPYELTVDQGSAIEDVKNDMQIARPMDRLIVGDVGYGKTEVAMRAAFKAVMDGRQVAILAPTTVLAYQHYETFSRRFGAFPVKIDLLSRFRSNKEQKAVVETAAKGEIDVLIGTHRLLSLDVKLPKLGLVVVDEEQRFGVAHKEKLKQLKKKVDVLTLSATPIPRTLNMSLVGMRDMSVIETPPRDRLAINTQVVQFSESVIRSAIDLELARSGQVFFIHNRVETIESIAALVQKIVPAARIAVGHGQMNEKAMEQVMLDFIDYKYDILVATTIIENGIDIPRANTIIINRADNYGLSQLYQLRGRVGRSNRRAYAYLLIPSELELTPIARRRLSAIREFSDLGAGFRIAALDLELRGAGNLLGGQQSGHLDALGFDLYTKMLERTIAEIRGDEIADETSVSINLGVEVSIPKEYIQEASHRLRTYKRIASAESEAELVAIRAELKDRYGRIPDSVDNLIAFGRLRKTAEKIGIVSIDKTASGLAVKLAETARVAPDRLMAFLSTHDGSSFSPGGILRVDADNRNPIAAARHILDLIRI